MKVKDIIAVIEEFAPLQTQCAWDNSGLQIGRTQATINSAVITLDVTEQAVQKAIELKAGLIISHHPLFFNPLRSITDEMVLEIVEHGIAVYSSHTPSDIAKGGINDYLANKLSLQNVIPLDDEGMGRIGDLPQEIDTDHFITKVKALFDLPTMRYSKPISQQIRRVALCGGSGCSLMEQAQNLGAQALLTGDVKYNNFGDAANHLTIIDIGHFESEKQFIEIIAAKIQEKIPTFVTHYNVEPLFNIK